MGLAGCQQAQVFCGILSEFAKEDRSSHICPGLDPSHDHAQMGTGSQYRNVRGPRQFLDLLGYIVDQPFLELEPVSVFVSYPGELG